MNHERKLLHQVYALKCINHTRQFLARLGAPNDKNNETYQQLTEMRTELTQIACYWNDVNNELDMLTKNNLQTEMKYLALLQENKRLMGELSKVKRLNEKVMNGL